MGAVNGSTNSDGAAGSPWKPMATCTATADPIGVAMLAEATYMQALCACDAVLSSHNLTAAAAHAVAAVRQVYASSVELFGPHIGGNLTASAATIRFQSHVRQLAEGGDQPSCESQRAPVELASTSEWKRDNRACLVQPSRRRDLPPTPAQQSPTPRVAIVTGVITAATADATLVRQLHSLSALWKSRMLRYVQ